MRANDFQLIRQAMKEASGQSMPITMAFTMAVFENLLRPLSKLAQASARRVGMFEELGESLVQLARFGTWAAVGAVCGAAPVAAAFLWKWNRMEEQERGRSDQNPGPRPLG